jgi:hypothetical protein
LPILTKLQLPRKQKVALIVLFGCGLMSVFLSQSLYFVVSRQQLIITPVAA